MENQEVNEDYVDHLAGDDDDDDDDEEQQHDGHESEEPQQQRQQQQQEEQSRELGRFAAGVSSKPQRRHRPTNRSGPQRSKSAVVAATGATSTLTGTTAASNHHGRPPIRNRSGDFPHSRGSTAAAAASVHREFTSKSAHTTTTTTDDWCDFDVAPAPEPAAPIPKNSSASTRSHSSEDGDLDGPSFHGEESRRGLRLRERRELVKAISERRLPDGGEMGGGVISTDGSRKGLPAGSRSTKSGVTRTGSFSRGTASRSRNEALSTSRRESLSSSRRESMKALYRSNHHPHHPDETTPALHSASSADDLPGISSSSSRRRHHHHHHQHPPPKTKSGLEAGALAAVMDRRHPPTRSRSIDSTSLVTPTTTNESSIDASLSLSSHDGSSDPDAKWLERRQHKQDQIMSLAHDVKERFADAREKQEEQEYNSNMHNHNNNSAGHLDYDNDDDDQPMAMRTKKTVLEQLKKVANKTGAGARSLGKGTVNAIHDPKLAAKRLGHLSKDVGKATIKTALDPSKLAKGAKNVTVGSAKMGAGITKGVAKTTFGATKTVVKGGVNATTKSAMLTMKGTKKVVKGTVRAVKGHHKQKNEEEQEYNNRNLADRNQASLYDRISSMVQSTTTNDDDDHLEEAILAGLAAAQNGADPHNTRASIKGGSSILVPTNLVGSSTRGNWDV